MKRQFLIFVSWAIIALSGCSLNKPIAINDELNETKEDVAIPYQAAIDDGVNNYGAPTDSFDLGSLEPVLYYDIFKNEPSNLEKEKDELLRRTVSAGFSSEDEVRHFINYYLEMQGIYKEHPDNVAYVNGKIASEYYIDKESKQCCFVSYYIPPPDSQNNDYFNNNLFVTCITVPYESLEQTGYIGYEHDIEQGTAKEVFYDMDRNQKVQVTYKYVQGIPFPIIIDYDTLNPDSSNLDGLFNLMTNARFRLYEDFITYDEIGKLYDYDSCIFQYFIMNNHDVDYFKKEYSNSFSYDENEKLISIKEEPQTDDFDWFHWEGLYDYTGLIEINYQENGEPSDVEHSFFSYAHGTWDSSGYAIYDSQGRMVYRYHYVTSGGYSFAWFYEGDSREPWASIEWGGMYYSGIRDLDYYADFTDVPDWVIDGAERGYFYEYGCQTIARIFKELEFDK